MTDQPRFLNRELSWLEFNQRVLDEARDDSLPLLERLKFLAITASNLDEFFMVRVGGLRLLVEQGITASDPSGMSPAEQLAAIRKRAHQMAQQQQACFAELETKLAEAGIRRVRGKDLNDRQARAVEQVFEGEIFSVLTPMAVAAGSDFPLLINQMSHVCVQLKHSAAAGPGPRFAIIPLGRTLPRFFTLGADRGYSFVLLEDVIGRFVGRFFPGEEVTAHAVFRITRNADFTLRDDLATDLLAGMEGVLTARKHGQCVRLEFDAAASETLVKFLTQALQVVADDLYATSAPVDLASFMQLTDLAGFEQLKYEPWPPQPTPVLEPGASLFPLLARQDVLLYHPYQSFDPVLRLVEEAAADPDVLAIKQILYRTSRHSPIVAALARAAQRGKYVTAIVELKARFDEARNIEWARNLEEHGVQVIYGVKGLKTHAKTCIIVRREPHGVVRYVHFGTGNYNEITARLYSDASLLTSNEELGADAVAFFHAITGYSQPQRYRKIEAAPTGLRPRIVELIEAETHRQQQGQKAFINVKVNSLVDPEIINSLYAASQAGVPVRLNVRGICCLRPGVAGLSENISVVSIVDRYLEHARILHFHHGGDELVFLSSADWMPRNLDRRIELLVPVEDPPSKSRLIEILETCFDDNVKARHLQADGSYTRGKGKGKKKPRRSQELLFEDARRRVKEAEQSRQTTFEPHRAGRKGVGLMKTLLLLRHAKSSWKEEGLDDHDRPLNARGKRNAPRMGQLLRDENLLPDLILSSSARRCRKTAEHVIQNSGYRGETRITSDLYEAGADQHRQLLARLQGDLGTVLLIAHNPGLEELLESLTGDYTPLTTAALAQLELPIDRWQDLDDKTRGRLVNLWQPRELET